MEDEEDSLGALIATTQALMVGCSCVSGNLLQFPCSLLELNVLELFLKVIKTYFSEEVMLCYSKGLE